MGKHCTLTLFLIFGTACCGSALTTFGKSYPTTTVYYDYSTTTIPPLKKVYHVHSKFTANWYRANHYCLQNNMRLASVFSEREHDQLKKQIKDTEYTDNFWIALTNLGNKKFYWFGYNKPATFTKWEWDVNRYDVFGNSLSTSEPPFQHQCAVISGTKLNWTTADCNELGFFVCESDISQ